MMLHFPVLGLGLLALLSPAAGRDDSTRATKSSNDSRPEVIIDLGRVAGIASPATVNRFLGLPFAAPPTRFDVPHPADKWQGTYDASQQKPACIQKFAYPEAARDRSMQWFNTPPPPAGESEDCLYLDVYAPAGAAPGSKPVLFWLFGGGFNFGTGSLSRYDGASFAENQDVVIVSPNYRTNVFGFPEVPEKPDSEMNLGFLDQRMALDWVQRNIHAFGGDPKRVTLFGESAGAGSVDVLVSNPPEPLPFVGAIMQSGQSAILPPTLPQPMSPWEELVKALGCDGGGANSTSAASNSSTLACVRAAPASRIKDIVERQNLAFGPSPDGGTTWKGTGRQDRLSSKANAPGRLARVPVLIGSNADKGGVFVYGTTNVRETLESLVPESLRASVNPILAAYPADNSSSPGPVNRELAAIYGDLAFVCPAKVVSEESAAVGIPAWRYHYDAAFANTEIYPDSGAYHSSEIYAVHGNYPRAGATAFQAKISTAMQKAWADFAKDPARGPGWTSVPDVAVFGGGVRPRDGSGDDGGGRPVVQVGRPDRIDRFCPLYKPLYDAVSLK